MFQKIAISMVIFLAAMFQVSVFPNIFPSGLSPEILLVLVVFWVSKSGFEKNIFRIILSGAALDFFYLWPAGINIIALSFTAFLTGSLAKRFLVSQRALNFFMIVVFVVVGTLVNHITLSFLVKFMDFIHPYKEGIMISSVWGKEFLARPLINAAFFATIYWPLMKMEKIMSFYDRSLPQSKFMK